jgi:hypothetical protein
MMDRKQKQMPVFSHDRAAYLREMYEWHAELSLEPGNEGNYHSTRAEEYRIMMDGEPHSTELMYY